MPGIESVIESVTESVIDSVSAGVVRFPLSSPESDGTLTWSATEVVLAQVRSGGKTGLGYTYADPSIASLINQTLAPVLRGREAMDIAGSAEAQRVALRNLGVEGHAFRAISALDIALWDLKARLLDISLVNLLGPRRTSAVVYGSGGFTSLTEKELCLQLAGWASQGIRSVKMKVGTRPEEDPRRVAAARGAIGAEVGLFVDANGAYGPKQAVTLAGRFAEMSVQWFEEPVPQAEAEQLRWLRDRLPVGMELAAGEYSTTLQSAARLISPQAVDVLQADVTRCGGISGFLQIATLCEAASIPLSAHCAPALHAHLGCVCPLRHIEYFHDHVQAERLLFEEVPVLRQGRLAPDLGAPGLGLTLKSKEALDALAR